MIGFIGTSLQLQSIITSHNQWLSKTRSIPCWTTSVFSSTVTNDERRTTNQCSHIELPLTTSVWRISWIQVKVEVKVTLRLTVIQSVRLGVEPRLGHTAKYVFLFESYWPVHVGRPLWREVGSWIQFYVTIDGQPASLSWNKAPIRGLRPDLY
jgi:hypothetical protein